MHSFAALTTLISAAVLASAQQQTGYVRWSVPGFAEGNDVQIRTKAENSWAEWDTYAEQIPSNSPVGWREGDDENTEVVIELSGPTFEESGISVVYQTSSGDGSAFYVEPAYQATLVTKFHPDDKQSTKRDLYEEGGDAQSLDYITRTLAFNNEGVYDDCSVDTAHMTIVTTDADGQTQTITAENGWNMTIPEQMPFTVNMTYAEDPNFYAFWNYTSNVYKYTAAPGFTGRIEVSENARLDICPDSD